MILRLVARGCALVLITAGLSVTAGAAAAAASAELEGPRFVTTWDTATDTLVELPLYGAVDVTIAWGDGDHQQVSATREPGTARPVSHVYSDGASTHQVTVVGSFTKYGSAGDSAGNLLTVDEWGATGTTDLSFAFVFAKKLTAVAGIPSGVTNMTHLFYGAEKFNHPIEGWDVSQVTDMSGMFATSAFNRPIDAWDVSRVTDMRSMFYSTPFDRPLGTWDVSQVTNMRAMFQFSRFNQPIGDWDVADVTDMSGMFWSTPFNQPVGGWDVSQVTDMTYLFAMTPFNQPIGAWDVSHVTTMGGMFRNAPFNQPIGGWDVSHVTDMSGMFWGSEFNQPIGAWDVSHVTQMTSLFTGSPFNQPIGGWDVSRVREMVWLFANTPFNRPIGDWDLSGVTDEDDMDRAFFQASSFNQDLSGWCVPAIPEAPPHFDEGALAWTLPRPVWGTCGGQVVPDTTPPSGAFTSATGADGVLHLRGTATDDRGVRNVAVGIRNLATGKWLRRDGTWGAFQKLYTALDNRGGTFTSWRTHRAVPSGTYGVTLVVVDISRNRNPTPRPWRRVTVS